MNNSDLIKKGQAKKDATAKQTRAHVDSLLGIPPQPLTGTVLVLRDDTRAPIQYDVDLLADFLDLVFHTQLEPEEEVCCYFDKGNHGYPITDTKLLRRVDTSDEAASLYMGTSTVWTNADGRIYNRKDAFARWHVLVLDDINTKVPIEKIPKGFEPTYIIESSPNNFQYGYVFDEPIEDYDKARALIELVYSGGYSDEGGKLVNKKVRLPEGINGKKGSPKEHFRVNLRKTNGPVYTPQEVLTALSLSTTWAAIEESAEIVRKNNRAVVGTSLWSPMNAQHASMDGVIDPITEWLADNHLIIGFDGAWIEITCPWATDHTEGGDTAYYSPIGFGEGEFKELRGYFCFHSHYDLQKTQEFLNHVALNGGPECAQYDPAAALVASHVFDSENCAVWGIDGVFPRLYGGIKGFELTHNRQIKTTFINPKGAPETKRVSVAALFQSNPSRVVVEGTTFDPTTTARLVSTQGRLLLNTFSPPDWGDGAYDMDIVQVFLNFIEYLVPHEIERKFFLDWLAAKVQNLGFRGWGVMMIAKAYGTGRGTLEMILTRLFDPRNCANVSYDDLINPKTVFNEWQAKLMVFTGESKATTQKSFYDAYTKLRDIIDTMPKMIEINHKTRGKENRFLHTSHMLFSNFEAAANIDNSDRRMFVITNPTQFESPKYFDALNAWANKKNVDGDFEFVNHLARYLKNRPVDFKIMNGRAPDTQGKDLMIDAARDVNTIFVDAFIAGLPTQWSCAAMLVECASKLWSRLDEPKMEWLTEIYNQRTTSGISAFAKLRTKSVRPRITTIPTEKVPEFTDSAEIFCEEKLGDSRVHRLVKREIRDGLAETNMVDLTTYINDQLDLAGR